MLGVSPRPLAQRSKKGLRRSVISGADGRPNARSAPCDHRQTLRRFAELAVPRIADWCSVTTLDDQDAFDRVAVVHRDPSKEQLVSEYEAKFPPGEPCGGALLALRSKKTVVMASVSDDDLVAVAQSDDHLRVLRGLGCESCMMVPMVARGESVGVMLLVRCASRRSFGPKDVAVAEELAHRAALVVENTRLHRQAQTAVQMREDFLSMASHEFKTPLTGLQLQVNNMQRVLAKSGPLDLQKIAWWVDNIDKQVGRLTDLVAGLIDASQVGAARLRPESEEVDLAEVVRCVAERFRSELVGKGYTLSLDVAGPIMGPWDRSKLEEIVTKFLGNAIKYGAGKPIAISVRRAEAEVTIEVSDQGIGMSTPDQKRVFKRFSRVASSQHYAGFGLGLWIARVLVEAMSGRVEVQSALGMGSSFRAFLPSG